MYSTDLERVIIISEWSPYGIFNIINPIQEFGLFDKFKMVSSPETEIRRLKFSRNINVRSD